LFWESQVCTATVSGIEAYLELNTTEEEAAAFLDKICYIPPPMWFRAVTYRSYIRKLVYSFVLSSDMCDVQSNASVGHL
jgi:hypothetical protein